MPVLMTQITDAARMSRTFFNQPIVKEGIKNVVGGFTCVFGVMEVYELYKMARGQAVSAEPVTWLKTAEKVARVCVSLSVLCSCGVSRPGVFVISHLANSLLAPAILQKFGPNTLFAINPWHPRHVFSFVAVALSLPAIALSLYKSVIWLKEGRSQSSQQLAVEPQTTSKLRRIWTQVWHWSWTEGTPYFTVFTSRPFLHYANWAVRKVAMRR